MRKDMNKDPCRALISACALLDQGEIAAAKVVIQSEYPFVPLEKCSRNYTSRKMTSVFLRDGFIDRYRGTKLVYPPALRLISHYLPESFPYHKNGKMDKGYIAYWEIFPTIDHIVPVARGGTDAENNWVCCSMITNSIKSNWLLQELEWTLKEPGSLNDWDGLFFWFLKHVTANTNLLANSYIKNWYNAGIEITHNHGL